MKRQGRTLSLVSAVLLAAGFSASCIQQKASHRGLSGDEKQGVNQDVGQSSDAAFGVTNLYGDDRGIVQEDWEHAKQPCNYFDPSEEDIEHAGNLRLLGSMATGSDVQDRIALELNINGLGRGVDLTIGSSATELGYHGSFASTSGTTMYFFKKGLGLYLDKEYGNGDGTYDSSDNTGVYSAADDALQKAADSGAVYCPRSDWASLDDDSLDENSGITAKFLSAIGMDHKQQADGDGVTKAAPSCAGCHVGITRITNATSGTVSIEVVWGGRGAANAITGDKDDDRQLADYIFDAMANSENDSGLTHTDRLFAAFTEHYSFGQNPHNVSPEGVELYKDYYYGNEAEEDRWDDFTPNVGSSGPAAGAIGVQLLPRYGQTDGYRDWDHESGLAPKTNIDIQDLRVLVDANDAVKDPFYAPLRNTIEANSEVNRDAWGNANATGALDVARNYRSNQHFYDDLTCDQYYSPFKPVDLYTGAGNAGGCVEEIYSYVALQVITGADFRGEMLDSAIASKWNVTIGEKNGGSDTPVPTAWNTDMSQVDQYQLILNPALWQNDNPGNIFTYDAEEIDSDEAYAGSVAFTAKCDSCHGAHYYNRADGKFIFGHPKALELDTNTDLNDSFMAARDVASALGTVASGTSAGKGNFMHDAEYIQTVLTDPGEMGLPTGLATQIEPGDPDHRRFPQSLAYFLPNTFVIMQCYHNLEAMLKRDQKAAWLWTDNPHEYDIGAAGRAVEVVEDYTTRAAALAKITDWRTDSTKVVRSFWYGMRDICMSIENNQSPDKHHDAAFNGMSTTDRNNIFELIKAASAPATDNQSHIMHFTMWEQGDALDDENDDEDEEAGFGGSYGGY